MVRNVITIRPEDDVARAARLLVDHDVSALPVVDDSGHVVGVLSEADLIHREEIGTQKQDRAIRRALLARLAEQHWSDFGERNVVVDNGIVHLWGLVDSPEQRKALCALARDVPGVQSVADEMIPSY
jgi:CBS domain-containing protein